MKNVSNDVNAAVRITGMNLDFIVFISFFRLAVIEQIYYQYLL